MTYRLPAMLTLLALFSASCASSDGPGREPAPMDPQQWRSPAQGTTGEADQPAPPRDAQWTLLGQEITGPNHVALARRLKQQLVETTDLPDWYVVHGERQSTLYYGFYRSFNDPDDRRESERAQHDRRQLNQLTDAIGDRPFRHAIFVALDSPADDDGPPEWDLANADGYWSVQIAAYHGIPERREAAVETVRAAREMGVEAYYFHGESVSSVCVGVWPREAVREQEAAHGHAQDPSQPILLLPHAISGLPDDIRTPEGERVKAMAPRVEIEDPSLLEVMKQYPTHAVNGYEQVRQRTDPETGATVEVPDPSFLIEIPRREPSILAGDGSPADQRRTTRDPDAWDGGTWQPRDDPYVSPDPPPAPSQQRPGAGRLRALD